MKTEEAGVADCGRPSNEGLGVVRRLFQGTEDYGPRRTDVVFEGGGSRFPTELRKAGQEQGTPVGHWPDRRTTYAIRHRRRSSGLP